MNCCRPRRMNWSAVTGAFAMAVGSMTLTSCRIQHPDEESATTTSALQLPAVTVAVSIQTPKGVPPTTVTLAAAGDLLIGGDTTIKRPGTGLATITNTGSTRTRAEPAAVLGDVWSGAPVELRDRVHVLGKVRAPSVVPGVGVVIDGGIDTTTPRTPPIVTSWSVTFPAANVLDVSVAPNTTASRSPGRYGAVQIFGGATLNLSAGTYYFEKLTMESNSRIVLSQDAGPVLLYVRASAIMRGAFATTSGAAPDLLLGYLGTPELIIETPFNGTIVSSTAKLTLRAVPGSHVGAFFAKNIEVRPNAQVTFRPGNVIRSTQPPGRIADCASAIVADDTLTGKAQEIQYQRDILRYCTGTTLSPCEMTLRARMNADFYRAAALLMRDGLTTTRYLAAVRDREDRIAAFRADPALACRVVSGDADGDYVPDSSDACPGTPELTAVLANGCTNSNLPPGPNAEEVKRLVKNIGVNVDPRCAGATKPAVPAPLGAWRSPANPTVGKAIWVSREPSPSTCPIYYQVEFYLTDGAGLRSITFPGTEDVVLPWITRPAGTVQFNLRAADGGDRAAWSSYSVYTRSFRARVFNAAGQSSEWSDFFVPGREDCPVGGPCQDL
jgi:hypothetical protein